MTKVAPIEITPNERTAGDLDVFLNFGEAIESNVMVTPTLIVTNPPPGATLIGDLRDLCKLRAAVGLSEAEMT